MLISKGVEVDKSFKVCGLSDESLSHLFFEYPFAINVWNKISCHIMTFFLQTHKDSNFLDAFFKDC